MLDYDLAKMRAIIEGLAVNEPYFLNGDYPDVSVCVLCDQLVSEEDAEELPQHQEDCPYRLAGELVVEWTTFDPTEEP